MLLIVLAALVIAYLVNIFKSLILLRTSQPYECLMKTMGINFE